MVHKLKFARSLFSKRNTSLFLNPLSSYMPSRRGKAFYRHSDTSPDLPFWVSLRDASDVMGSPKLSMKAGFHMVALERCSPSVPLPAPAVVPFFCYTLVILGSLASGYWMGWGISPSLELSICFPFFLFFSGPFAAKVWDGAGVSGRCTIGTTRSFPLL